MAGTTRASSGRRLALMVAAVFAVLALFGATSTAFAEEVRTIDVGDQTIIIDPDAPVVKQTCNVCHANISNTKNYSSEIIFSHGYHTLIQCSGCHSAFPHIADAGGEGVDTSRPTMQGCFACHGLRHGPMGEIASDACEDCHNTAKERLRPSFHVFGWVGEPHVKPALDEFNTKCSMCHDKASCDECHQQEGVRWEPASWAYDSGEGCMACHGSQNLRKDGADGPDSFYVTGLEESAHRKDVTCQQCHPDFRYDDQEAASKVWQVNAGYACANCHEKAEKEEDRVVVDEWKSSVHYAELEKGNADSATCASCHGGHMIPRLDTEYAKQLMHGSAYRVCARCHAEEYESYDDYYHGAAYKQGATDAPACWECHGDHAILPSSDKASMVSDTNLASTCGQCHEGSAESFGAEAGQLIHSKRETFEQNPLQQIITRVRAWVG